MSRSKVPSGADDPLLDVEQVGSGVTAYVVNTEGALDAENPVYQAIVALADTVNQVPQDLTVVVIARKGKGRKGLVNDPVDAA